MRALYVRQCGLMAQGRSADPDGYRTIQIQAGQQTNTADDPIPDDLRAALNEIHRRSGAH
jgi:hypothetical protein